jgi:hypothetical protein
MITPTPEYDPMFADDDIPLRTKMIQYIEREFGDLLGAHRGLLRTDEGLATLSRIYLNNNNETSPPAKAA